MPYAEVADLQTYMSSFGVIDTGAATLALQLVSDSIDQWLGLPDGQTLLSQTITGQVLDGPMPGSSTLVLPSCPVTAVTAVSEMRSLGTWTDLAEAQDYLWTSSGILTRITSAYTPDNPVAPKWPRYPQSINVSWTVGYDQAPAGVRAVCLSAAARIVANPLGLNSLRIGSGYEVRFSASSRSMGGGGGTPGGSAEQAGGNGGIEFNATELTVLGRYRSLVVVA